MTITTELYSLSITHKQDKTHLFMQMNTSFLTTRHLPLTLPILADQLPGVLRTKCFNDKNLPFSQEVQKTEIGHLFEHILLQYMLELKIESGHKKCIFDGLTSWDWTKEPRGIFHIQITASKPDTTIFYAALDKSKKLLDTILNSRIYSSSSSQNKDITIPILA